MIVILKPNTDENSNAFKKTWEYLSNLDNIRIQKHKVEGKFQRLTEIYLFGDTAALSK